MPLFFNESRWIALTVYNWLFVFGTAETLRITLQQMTPATALAIQVAAVILAGTHMLYAYAVYNVFAIKGIYIYCAIILVVCLAH